MRAQVDLLGAFGSLLRHPHARRASILEFQGKRLARVVAQAYERVPYYRQLLDSHGVRPADVRSPADLPLVAITTKDALRAQAVGDVVARGLDPRRLIAHVTSGSSGEPFTIFRTWLEERLLGAFRLRALHGFGMRPTDRLVALGLARSPHAHDPQLPQRLAAAMGLYRRQQVSCMQPVADILRAVRDARGDVMTGYPGVVARLADALEADGGPPPPLRFIGCVGEVLAAATRRRIAERFAAPVFELYATFEFGLLGAECRETGLLHVADDNVVVEILRDGRPAKPGEQGEVVVTSLHAVAMPFLRYRLGDLAVRGPEPCPCGRPFSTVANVQGRILDYFPLPDGRLLHPYEIIVRLPRDRESWIRRYRILQERIDRVTLRIVPARPPAAEQIDALRRALAPVLGRGVDLGITLVPEIEDEPSGKFRVARSLVPLTGPAAGARCPPGRAPAPPP